MPKLFAVSEMQGPIPRINTAVTPYHGHVLCDRAGQYGAYLFSGTAAQLTALAALPEVVAIVGVTESDEIHWGELDGIISGEVRTRLNTWLTGRDYPTIPAGWTYRQVLDAVYKRVNANWKLVDFDVAES